MDTTPEGPTLRLVVDGALEHLARRLRILGYDSIVHRGARFEELLAEAERDGRALVTASHRHPRRWAAVRVVVVPREDLAEGVRRVIAAGAPGSRPLTRCTRCNGVIASRSAFEAHGELPGRVARQARGLGQCTTCGHWYWLGAHTDQLRTWARDTLGRSLNDPAASA